MAVLTNNWVPASRISPESAPVVTSSDTADDPATGTPASTDAPSASMPRAEKPLAIYVTVAGEATPFDKFDKVVLTDDKIAIGLKAFKTIKMTPEEASNDPLLAKGKDVPRFYFVSPDYKDVTLLEGSKLSVSGFYNAMKAEAKKHFKGDFDKNVREMRDVLNEWDKIAKERKILEEKKAREDKPTPADIKKMEKELADIDTREKKANELRDNLMKFEPKEPSA
jgi:hypothetical protein